MAHPFPESVASTVELLAKANYFAPRSLATAIFLALRMQKPLLVEGDAGVGKTEIAKALAEALERPLVRLQCYEGLDIASAVYEWNYQRQMIEIRLAEAAHDADRHAVETKIFSDPFLLKRPILQALQPADGIAPILLIDELDRADAPFEAFLLEVLAEWQVTIPELGTIRAAVPPVVIITSNRTREIHDAIKRRCLYHWLDYPEYAREIAIVQRKVPGISDKLTREIVSFIQRIRGADLFKPPGVAETIDWARALEALAVRSLDNDTVQDTLGLIAKYQDDAAKLREQTQTLLCELDVA